MLFSRVLAPAAFTLLLFSVSAVAQPTHQEKAAANRACDEGHKLATAKKYDEAIAAFTKAIALDPDSDLAHFSRAGVHSSRPDVKNRRLDLAIFDLDRVIELLPGDYSALANRAGCHRESKNYDEAIRGYTEIIDGKTDFSRHLDGKDACLAVTHFSRGDLYLWPKQDNDRAIKDFTEALRLNPSINEWAFVYSRRASAYAAKKEYAKASEDFAAEVSAHPDHPGSLCWTARLLATCPDAKCRNGKKAVELAEQAKKLTDGKDSETLDILAATYAETGEFDKAVEWQKKAIELLGPKPGEQAKAMEARLALYRTKKPYREE